MTTAEQSRALRRCGARTRSGAPCKNPPVRSRTRCRMHGGTNPGAPRGNRNAWKHGLYSAEAIAERRRFRALLQQLQGGLEEVRELSCRTPSTPERVPPVGGNLNQDELTGLRKLATRALINGNGPVIGVGPDPAKAAPS